MKQPLSRYVILLLAAMLAPVGVLSQAAPAAPAPLPDAVDLRPEFVRWQLAQRRQGDRPTCSVFTVAGALEFAAARQQERGTRFSIEFLNWAANKTCGGTEDGGFFSDLWKGFANYGICTETDMPYQARLDPALLPDSAALAGAKTRTGLGLRHHWIKEWNVNTGLTEKEFAGVQRTLAQGWPVCGGFRWPKQERWVENVLQMCPSNSVRDGHSVLLVGYRNEAAQPGGGVFIFRNSGGSGRDGLMPYAYAREYMNDALWIECQAKSSTAKPITSAAKGLPVLDRNRRAASNRQQ